MLIMPPQISIPTAGNIPEGRTWHTLSAASDKHLFLYGGFNNDQEALGQISYIFNHNKNFYNYIKLYLII